MWLCILVCECAYAYLVKESKYIYSFNMNQCQGNVSYSWSESFVSVSSFVDIWRHKIRFIFPFISTLRQRTWRRIPLTIFEESQGS